MDRITLNRGEDLRFKSYNPTPQEKEGEVYTPKDNIREAKWYDYLFGNAVTIKAYGEDNQIHSYTVNKGSLLNCLKWLAADTKEPGDPSIQKINNLSNGLWGFGSSSDDKFLEAIDTFYGKSSIVQKLNITPAEADSLKHLRIRDHNDLPIYDPNKEMQAPIERSAGNPPAFYFKTTLTDRSDPANPKTSSMAKLVKEPVKEEEVVDMKYPAGSFNWYAYSYVNDQWTPFSNAHEPVILKEQIENSSQFRTFLRNGKVENEEAALELAE